MAEIPSTPPAPLPSQATRFPISTGRRSSPAHVVATAISLVLFAFGAALGLGMVSPEDGSVPGRWLAIAAGLWFVCVVVAANVAGGYLTGRMRRRTGTRPPTSHRIRMITSRRSGLATNGSWCWRR